MAADYDFSTLSPIDFELFTRDLLWAEYRLDLEAFGQGPDGGVDLRGLDAGIPVIVQCKHYAKSKFSDLRRAIKAEKPKLASERPERYFLVTSQDLTRTQKDELARELSPWIPNTRFILGRKDINHLIDKNPLVEQKNFKLWLASVGVIERIVQSGLWERSEALMEDIQERVKLYVSNPSYDRAFSLLKEHHVALIIGAPGVGKSMLAEMLLLTHWQQGWQVVSVGSDIEEAWAAWRSDRDQIFLYDDFLGQTDIGELLGKNEGSRIARFINRVTAAPRKKLVLTSRTHTLRQGQMRDERLSRASFYLPECTLLLADYGPRERAQILYNHLYFSNLERLVIRQFSINEGYWPVVTHRNFTPRIIEQMIKQGAGSGEHLRAKVLAGLERPIDIWGPSFTVSLSKMSRNVLMALATYPPRRGVTKRIEGDGCARQSY